MIRIPMVKAPEGRDEPLTESRLRMLAGWLDRGDGVSLAEALVLLPVMRRLIEEREGALPPGGTTAAGSVFGVGVVVGGSAGEKRAVTIELDGDPGPIRMRDRVHVTWLGRSGE